MSEFTEQLARETYEKYLEEGLKMFPPLKGYGMKLIQFSIDEPKMYRKLFLERKEYSYIEFLENQVDWNKIIPSIQLTLELNEKDAKWLFKNLLFYAHGMASLFSSSVCVMTEKEIAQHLGEVCRGLLMQLKAPVDDRVKIIPKEQIPIGEIDEYVKGKKNVIIGYGQEKEMYQIRLDAILYFEAVGENVFAYTKSNVFEIKKRLYKIEELVHSFSFVRASKSLLVNTSKVVSICSEPGGRGKLIMINGEAVMASRSYYKSVLEQIKMD